MKTKEEKQIIKENKIFKEVIYVYDEEKGGHPLEVKERLLSPEEITEEEAKEGLKKEELEEFLKSQVTLEKLDKKLDQILEKLNA